MPWTYENPPDVAQNWTDEEIRACVDAANAVLRDGGTDEEAIYACIHAAGKEEKLMGKKIFRAPIELKADGEEGTFRSVFARFNVIDHDGDVTLPGAFRDGQEVVVEGWNHDYGLPPGKGVIHTDEEKAWIDGQFFLDTTAGKDHYLTLRNLGGLEEWSYTFDIEQSEQGEFESAQVRFLKELDVWGVAPVTRGAGIGTGTVTIKSADRRLDGNERKFAGSPRNPYGTHASRGYPGGRDAWKRAWRIYLSSLEQGTIQGTIRRIGMIAATMECSIPSMSADDVEPRSGACGELDGESYETPGDYDMDEWKDPSDDDLTQEDVQLTCQDLEDLKRACLAEIAKRHACEEEDGKGKAGDPTDPDGKPSGVSPSVLLTKIDILELEE